MGIFDIFENFLYNSNLIEQVSKWMNMHGGGGGKQAS